jgi:hypothetical protein
MALIQSWLDSAYRWFEKIKGGSIVRRTYRVSDLGEQLTGHSVAGYEIRLYCQQKHYVREYLWWIFPRQTYSTFRVFGSVTADAPASLKKACELDIDLPRLRPRFLSEALQVEAAIQAYLDILVARLREESGGYHSLV